jgi:two-component system chemotaxis response regulator CheY
MTGMNGAGEDVLRLPAVLDLAAAEDFLGSVLQQLQAAQSLCLDACAVETLTLPCVQIILAAIATHRVTVVNPTEAFASAFRDMALDWRTEGGALDEPARVAPAPELPIAAAPEPVSAPEPVLASMPEPEIAEPVVSEPVVSEPVVAEPVVALAPEPVLEPEAAEPTPEPLLAAAPDLVPDPIPQPLLEPTTDAAPMPLQARSAEPAASSDTDRSIEQEPTPTDGSDMAKRILTIDDSKTMRDMLMLTLAEAGFEVIQAVDGQHGLDVLGDERVDVIITDINMPILDGYGVIRNLRKNPVHKATPILVLTTESDAEKKVIAREAGATGWMVKPFDPDRLIATIRKVAP